MYPPLYPIALLLSKLQPGDIGVTTVIKKEDLEKFVPLLVEAGNTPNYMGRVIIGKALLPFLKVGEILGFCVGLVRGLEAGKSNKVHN